MADSDKAGDPFELLVQAIDAGRTDIINTLLKEYDIDKGRVSPQTGDSPLHMACRGKHVDCVRALLKHKFPASLKNASGDLAYSYGDDNCKLAFQAELLQRVVAGDTSGVTDLLEGGTNPDTDGLPKSSSMLHWAITCGQLQVVGAIVKAGADVNMISENGDAPLHQLCRELGSSDSLEPTLDAIQLLLVAGADINIENVNGETPKSLLNEELSAAVDEVVANATREIAAKTQSPTERKESDGLPQSEESDLVMVQSDEQENRSIEYSIPVLQQRVAQLERREEEHLTIISQLRSNIETLLPKDGAKDLIQSLEGQLESLKLELKSLEDENSTLRQGLMDRLGSPEDIVNMMDLPAGDTLEFLQQKWLSAAMEDERNKHKKERQAYEAYIRELLLALPDSQKQKYGYVSNWDVPVGETSTQGKVNFVHHHGRAGNINTPDQKQQYHSSGNEEPSFFESFFSIFFGNPEDHYVDKELYRKLQQQQADENSSYEQSNKVNKEAMSSPSSTNNATVDDGIIQV